MLNRQNILASTQANQRGFVRSWFLLGFVGLLNVLFSIGSSPANLQIVDTSQTAADDGKLTEKETWFRENIAPIFQSHCLPCHNLRDRAAGFSLESAADLVASGFVDSDDPLSSRLLEVVCGDDSSPPEMPKSGEPLTSAEVALLRQWIQSGADWPPGFSISEPAIDNFAWWSLQPLKLPVIPSLALTGWENRVKNPIDAFVLAKILEQDLTPNPLVDRRTLIRRVTYDLTGLPPTAVEVQAFVEDPSDNAYEQLVDRLLFSPRYGERWGQHWLDLVRYADTCGYDKDKPRPHAWPYRDYVIRSINEDKPYAQFVEEQIAGDVIYPGTPDGILGLGFLAAGPWDFIGHVEVSESKLDGQEARNLDRDEFVAATYNIFSSTTVQCARCHNHKFDPITQSHYYDLQAVFAAIDRANRVYRPDPVAEAQRPLLAAEREKILAATAALNATIAAAANENGDDQPNPLKQELQSQQSTLAQQLAECERKIAELSPGEMVYAAATEFPSEGEFRATGSQPRDVRVLARGNVGQPGDVSVAGTIPLRAGESTRFPLSPGHTEGERRAALAHWITDRHNPLTWRSIVNRIWLHHFGRGLVDSPNDFGRMGQLPSHPELLDWLATEFLDHEQSFRHLHRLIVTSSVYQQTSDSQPAAASIDSDNRFLWRGQRRRLDAEEIRDSMLLASGVLNLEMGGPGYYLFDLQKSEHSPHYEYHLFDPRTPSTHRRTVYRFVVRSQPDPLMTTLDCADSSITIPQRDETLTALQALSLLNNPFALTMAETLAVRLERTESTLDHQIRLGFELTAGRQPTADEMEELLGYARAHGLINLCRWLFNMSEFVFID